MLNRKVWIGAGISLLTAVSVYWIWFFKWEIYTWGDWGFYFPETAKDFLTFPQVWLGSGLGGIDIGLSLYPTAKFLPGVLSFFMEAYKAVNLVYLLPSVIICSLGSYFLVRYIYNSEVAGVIGSWIYSFNTYFLIIRGGHLTLMNAFGIAPFAILAFLYGLRTAKPAPFVLAGLLGSIASAYEVRGGVMVFGLLALLLVLNLPSISIRKLFVASLTFITAILLNIYWVMGLFFTGGGTNDLVIFDRQLYGEGYTHIVRSAVLQLYQWAPKGIESGSIQQTPPYMWLIPLFAFAGLYLGRKNRTIVYFGIVALLGIFFSKMLGQPFPGVYPWLYAHFPGFSIFREPSKFFFLIAIGYSVLISGVVEWTWKIKSRVLKIGILLIISFCFLVNTQSVITGSLGELLKPRHLPQDYKSTNDLLLKENSFFRTIYYPVQSRWNISTSLNPGLSGLALTQTNWSPLANYNTTGLKFSYVDEVASILNRPYADKLFDMTSIKYVVIPTQDLENNNDIFAIFGGHRDDYLDLISKQNFLKHVETRTNELSIFENINFRPHIYLTSQLETIYLATISAQPVQYTRVSASEYRIYLKANDQPVYLNFTDMFHVGWKLSTRKVSWINILFNKHALLPDVQHLKNDAGLNSFIIYPGDIKENTPITLYFFPQMYLNIGVGISLFSLLIIMVYLIINRD